MKMTDEEKKVRSLYRRLLSAKKSYKEGKMNKDYESIIYNLQEEIDNLTNNKLSDGVISLRIKEVKDSITRFNIIELEKNDKIGEAIVNLDVKDASMNYGLIKQNNEYSLRTIKLLALYMKKNGIEKAVTSFPKENKELNNLLKNFEGANKELTHTSPYTIYTLNFKK